MELNIYKFRILRLKAPCTLNLYWLKAELYFTYTSNFRALLLMLSMLRIWKKNLGTSEEDPDLSLFLWALRALALTHTTLDIAKMASFSRWVERRPPCSCPDKLVGSRASLSLVSSFLVFAHFTWARQKSPVLFLGNKKSGLVERPEKTHFSPVKTRSLSLSLGSPLLRATAGAKGFHRGATVSIGHV